MADDIMLQEAIGAIRQGEIQRARDLLTRLLKTDPANPQHWLYMSAVVETAKERVYCLQEVLKRDPHNETARRGLVLLGALPPDEGPRPPMPRRKWQAYLVEAEEGQGISARKVLPRLVLIGGGALLAVGLIVMGVLGARGRGAFNRPLRPANTLRPSATYLPSPSPVVRSATPTFVGPAPLWMRLDATYTPTAMYVNTPHPLSEAYRAAVRRMQTGDLSGALNFMQQVADNEPNAPDVQYQIGEIYRQMGDERRALEAYNRAIQIDANFAPAYLGLARARLALDPEGEGVEDALAQALALDPSLIEATLELANARIQRGDGPAALEALDSAKQSLAESPLYYLYRAQAELLDGQKGAALLDALEANRRDLTLLDGYWTLARAYQANGKPADALEPLEVYTTYVTDDARAWVMLGTAYYARNQDEKAEAAFDHALQINNRLFDAYLQRGLIYLARDAGTDALNDLDMALKLDAKSFDASLGKGQAYLLLNYPGDAYIQINKTEGLAQSDAQKAALYYWRATALDALGKGDVALSDWQALLDLPAGAAQPEWLATARERTTPTATPTPTGGMPTRTQTATRTPAAGSTTPTAGTATRTPTPTRAATRTPMP